MKLRRMASAGLVLIAVLTAGCGGGGGGGGSSPGAVQPPPGGTNAPPTISGQPNGSVLPGQAYSFQPAASDPNGDTLTFSVANLPSWATFSSSTGRISGTPTAADVATYSGITITVS